jgi:heat shock protein HtpX
MSGLLFLSILSALFPGVFAWWSHRRLVRHLEDPAFPELLYSYSKKLGVVAGLSVALSLAFYSQRWYGYLSLGMVVLGLLVGSFPGRRVIFGESWSLAGYLGHAARFWTGLLGPFLLLVLLPVGLAAAGSLALPVGLSLAALALAWGRFNSRILPRWLGATRLERPDLDELFSGVLSQARTSRPDVFRAGVEGGHWVNAFAVPHRRRPAVVLTDGLLANLSPRETAALFAHEVAHLEHFDAKRLLQAELSSLGVFGLCLFLWTGPYREYAQGREWLWLVVLLVGFILALTRARGHEAESDRRAVELCGDPQALIDALTRIHVLSRISRRWEPKLESWSTHPSLARRLQAIRAASQSAPETAEEAVLIQAAKTPGEAVVLDRTGLHWLSGLPPGERDPAVALQASAERCSYRYSDLTDLRVEATWTGRYLKWTDVKGRSRKMALPQEEVARVQAILDRVDALLGSAPAPASRGMPWARLPVGAVLLIGSIAGTLWPLGPPAALALLRPAQASLAAPGVLTLGVALKGILRPAATWSAPTPLALGLEMVLGLGLLALAVVRYRQKASEPPWTEIATPSLCGALALLSGAAGVGALLGPAPAMELHQWARASLNPMLLMLGAAAALATLRGPKARGLALAAVLLACSITALGSLWFREHFTGDPLRALTAGLDAETWTPEKIRERQIDGRVDEIRLSPSGARVAAVVYRETENPYSDAELDRGGPVGDRHEGRPPGLVRPLGRTHPAPGMGLRGYGELRPERPATVSSPCFVRLSPAQESAVGGEGGRYGDRGANPARGELLASPNSR